jgi:hypothetical protein
VWEAEQALRYAEKSSRPVCVVVIDLDHFKHINDTYGHAAGERDGNRRDRPLESEAPSGSHRRTPPSGVEGRENRLVCRAQPHFECVHLPGVLPAAVCKRGV